MTTKVNGKIHFPCFCFVKLERGKSGLSHRLWAKLILECWGHMLTNMLVQVLYPVVCETSRGKIAGNTAETRVSGCTPGFSNSTTCCSPERLELTFTIPGVARSNTKWDSLLMPLSGLKSWRRYVSQSYQGVFSGSTSSATLHAAESTMSHSCWRVNVSDRRYFFFNSPKQPSTRQRVWPAVMKCSDIFFMQPINGTPCQISHDGLIFVLPCTIISMQITLLSPWPCVTKK